MAGVVAGGPPEKLGVFESGEKVAGLDEELYALRWAKKGERLALLRALPNEAADERLWKVQVLDLVNDKTVYEKEWFQLAAGVVGYLPNPHGDRLAILIKTTHRGYEGPPHVRRLVVVGGGGRRMEPRSLGIRVDRAGDKGCTRCYWFRSTGCVYC